MIRRTERYTRTETLFTDTTLFRSVLYDLFNGPANGLVHGQSDQEARIDHDGILPCVSFFGYIHILCDGGHRQLKVPGEPEIPFVSCWNRHNRPGPVTGQHIIGDPYRNLFSGKRM